MSDDLWGELPKAADIVHPKTVLDEQAGILAQRTNGLLQGRVETERLTMQLEFDTVIRFSIVCPTLQNYTFEVLSVYYNRLHVYPCNIVNSGEAQVASDADHFKLIVRSVLQSNSVKRAIAALLREVQDQGNLVSK